jgi:D-alanine-D-alanine ligase-like ATP-grasp enzyme
MHVGFIYNIATEELLREQPEQTLRDSDTIETIEEVTRALQAGGHTVTGLNADQRLPARLTRARFDVVFNIATGVYGESRQTHVPAMLEYLRIPHAGSGVLGEALCHHKHYQKMVFQSSGVPTAPFQMFHTGSEPVNKSLRFPLIVKLPSEGASMGLDYDSVVHDETELRARVKMLLDLYSEGVLVEEYIDGREFTVAVLGNNPAYTLPVAELEFFGQLPIRLDEIEDSNFELLKQATGRDLEQVRMESRSLVPANLPPELDQRIQGTAIAAFHALSCKDWARVDIRMDEQSNLYVLEVNLEPGIASDCIFARCAFALGWDFNRLVNTILDHAIERYPRLSGKTNSARAAQRSHLGSLAVERERA